jgi:DNA polymerase I-like protein with 3'-5' exonuclease and polymerase domains
MSFDRATTNLSDITARLANKKECQVQTTRVRNKITMAIDKAWEMLRKGDLKAEGNLETITTENRLKEYMEAIEREGEYVLDLETTGLDVFNDIIVGVCLYVKGQPSAYVPINHTDMANNRLSGQLDEATVIRVMKPIVTNKRIKTKTHNGKFDGKMHFLNWGVKIANFFWDTLVGAHVLDENEPHGLKYLYNKYVAKGKGNDFDYGDYFDGIPFNYIPIEIATIYGANDGYKTDALVEFQRQFLKADHAREDFRKLYHVFRDIEMPLIPVLINIETRGIQIRPDYAKELEGEMQADLARTEWEMDATLDEIKESILENELLNRLTKGTGKINFNAPAQLAALFYDVMKIPAPSRKKPRGTGRKEIGILKEKVKNETLLDFFDLLLEYKTLAKLLSGFVIALPNKVEPRTQAIHTEFNQSGTVTSRFSSTNPNLQNIPAREKRIRKMFRAREGYKLIGSDFSQIEPRVLSFITMNMFQGTEMWDAYMNGEDLYAMMASKIYSVPAEECVEAFGAEGKLRRDSVKSVLLGIMYERSAGDIAAQFGKPAKWGEEVVDLFKKAFPKVEMVRKYFIHHAETKGYAYTVDGRKRRLPDMMKSKKSWEYTVAFRQVLNSVVQGTAGDLLKKAMIRIGQDERLQELDAHLLLTIHDELIMECPDEHVYEAGTIMSEHMKAVGRETLGGLLMKCDLEVMDVWYGANVAEAYGL